MSIKRWSTTRLRFMTIKDIVNIRDAQIDDVFINVLMIDVLINVLY